MSSSQSSSVLLRLKRLYGGTLSVRSTQSSLDVLGEPSIQQEIIEQILLSDHFLMFPPSVERRRAFWKWVIQLLEKEGEEIDERIYNAYITLLSELSKPTAGPVLPSPSYITRFWRGNTDSDGQPYMTTVLESQTMNGTTGLRTWNASLALADWLITHPEIVQGSNILELGSGAGFLGLVIAQLQLNYLDSHFKSTHSSLTLSDGNSEVLQRCRQNFLLACNNMSRHQNLEFVCLDWSDAQDEAFLGDPHSTLNQTLQKVDIILGADLVYDITIVPGLIAVLKQFFRIKPNNEGNFVLFALTVRREETIETFLQSLVTNSLIYQEVDSTQRANELTSEMDNHGWKLFRIKYKRPE